MSGARECTDPHDWVLWLMSVQNVWAMYGIWMYVWLRARLTDKWFEGLKQGLRLVKAHG
jgi:hypothetical protein